MLFTTARRIDMRTCEAIAAPGQIHVSIGASVRKTKRVCFCRHSVYIQTQPSKYPGRAFNKIPKFLTGTPFAS
jgi:hypothetical protein